MLKLQYFGHLMQRTDSWEKTLMSGKAGGEGGERGWDGWMASLTPWTRGWTSSGSWGRTGRPGVLQSMGSQRVRNHWATELTDAHKTKLGFLLLICLVSTLLLIQPQTLKRVRGNLSPSPHNHNLFPGARKVSDTGQAAGQKQRWRAGNGRHKGGICSFKVFIDYPYLWKLSNLILKHSVSRVLFLPGIIHNLMELERN